MALTLDEIDQQLAHIAYMMRQALDTHCFETYDSLERRRELLLEARFVHMAARDRDQAPPLAG